MPALLHFRLHLGSEGAAWQVLWLRLRGGRLVLVVLPHYSRVGELNNEFIKYNTN